MVFWKLNSPRAPVDLPSEKILFCKIARPISVKFSQDVHIDVIYQHNHVKFYCNFFFWDTHFFSQEKNAQIDSLLFKLRLLGFKNHPIFSKPKAQIAEDIYMFIIITHRITKTPCQIFRDWF